MIDFFQTNWIEIAGTLLGFLYLYFELKAHKAMFPLGILSSLFYVNVFFASRLYAIAGINIYFIVAQAYAWWKWKDCPDQEEAPLRKTPMKSWILVILASIVLFVGLWWLLLQIPHGADAAWTQSLITALNIVAIWMLAQHYFEQWILLIVVNLFSVFLYFSESLYFTFILYIVYLIASFVGYIHWRKIAKQLTD